jgi:hypothetical protein
MMKAACAFPVLGLLLALSACGPSEAPQCSDSVTEKMVKKALLQRLETNDATGIGETGYPTANANSKENVFSVDLGVLEDAFSFAFSDERQRNYDKGSRKRYCTAAIKGDFDPKVAESSMSYIGAGDGHNWTKDRQNEVRKQAVEQMRGTVHWNNPQNYSVQYTEKGDVFVTLNE